MVGPDIEIKSLGVDVKDKDFISRKPRFKLILKDDVSLDISSIRVRVDREDVSVKIIKMEHNLLELEFERDDMATGKHDIEVKAKDMTGNPFAKNLMGLTIVPKHTQLEMVDQPEVSLSIFSPTKDKTCKIIYVLNKDTEAAVYIFGIKGDIVWSRKFVAQENGGMAGNNAVEFNGVSDDNSLLENGIYVYRVIAGSRVIGVGRIVIYE